MGVERHKCLSASRQYNRGKKEKISSTLCPRGHILKKGSRAEEARTSLRLRSCPGMSSEKAYVDFLRLWAFEAQSMGVLPGSHGCRRKASLSRTDALLEIKCKTVAGLHMCITLGLNPQLTHSKEVVTHTHSHQKVSHACKILLSTHGICIESWVNKTGRNTNSQLITLCLTLQMGILGIKAAEELAHDYNK